jgi:hypothetical protein
MTDLKRGGQGMNGTRAFALIKTELELLDPALQGHETDNDYRAGVVLLAAVWVTGADIEQLATFTGYDQDFVAAISLRMLKSGLWEESGLVHSDHWFHKGCYSNAAFWCDVLVGLGLLSAKPAGSSDFCIAGSRWSARWKSSLTVGPNMG